MIEPNQSRLDDLNNLNEHCETLHRGCLNVEKTKKHKNDGNECKCIKR